MTLSDGRIITKYCIYRLLLSSGRRISEHDCQARNYQGENFGAKIKIRLTSVSFLLSCSQKHTPELDVISTDTQKWEIVAD